MLVIFPTCKFRGHRWVSVLFSLEIYWGIFAGQVTALFVPVHGHLGVFAVICLGAVFGLRPGCVFSVLSFLCFSEGNLPGDYLLVRTQFCWECGRCLCWGISGVFQLAHWKSVGHAVFLHFSSCLPGNGLCSIQIWGPPGFCISVQDGGPSGISVPVTFNVYMGFWGWPSLGLLSIFFVRMSVFLWDFMLHKFGSFMGPFVC